MKYIARIFNLPSLEGISEKQMKAHLALYDGYVKHVNLIMEKLKTVREENPNMNPYMISELRRRFAFEFNGMRMHEFYFEQFVGGSAKPLSNSALSEAVVEKYGEGGLEFHIREVANTRGVGWVVVYGDVVANTIHTVFVNDHEVGQLSGLPILLALDLWEHAYMVDYLPADKKNYIDAFFKNLNWTVIEKRFEAVK